MEAAFWIAGGTAFVVVWAIFIFVTQHFRAQAQQQAREMLHKERLLAIEKDIPLAEFPSLDDEGPPPLIDDRTQQALKRAIPQIFLAFGLLSLATGIGMLLAFSMAPDTELNKIWSLGLIPVFVGIGCIIYYRLSRVPDE